MADVGITVAVGGDVSAFEAAVNKARALGKRWASDVAGDSVRSAKQVGDAWGGGFGKMGQAAIKFGGVLGLLPQQARNAVSAISSLFQASGGSPIALAIASIGAAAANAFKIMREEAQAAADHIAGVMDTLAKREEALRTVNSQDPIKRAKAKLALGDESGAAREAQDLRASAASYLQINGQGDSVGARQTRVYAGELNAQAAQIEAAIGAAKDAKLKEQMKRDEEAFARRQQAAKEAQARKEAEAQRARGLVESRRAAQVASAPSDVAANIARVRFTAEDYSAAKIERARAASMGDTAKAVEAQTRMNNLLAEAAQLLKDIRKNTESSKQ